MTAVHELRVAVLIPCFNESIAIADVVRDFKRHLPAAAIFVYDNNSSDGTFDVALAAGARVYVERAQGKGNVVRRMFADVDADIYVLVDGDRTYNASDAPAMIARLMEDRLDMIVASRLTKQESAYRRGHRMGNLLLTSLTSWIFGRSFTDMLSGYRVMTRRFVKSFPAHAKGFEIEVELGVHALELRMPVGEMISSYTARPEGSHSKLKTYRDGWRILRTIIRLTKNGRPLAFFSAACAACAIAALVLALPIFHTYFLTGLVPRFPTAILSASIALLGGIFLVCGLILDTVTLGRREAKYALYLNQATPIYADSSK